MTGAPKSLADQGTRPMAEQARYVGPLNGGEALGLEGTVEGPQQIRRGIEKCSIEIENDNRAHRPFCLS